jgi:hypothetical protein
MTRSLEGLNPLEEGAATSALLDVTDQLVTKVWLRSRLRRMVTTPAAPPPSTISMLAAPTAASPQSKPLEAALVALGPGSEAGGMDAYVPVWAACPSVPGSSKYLAPAVGARIAETTRSAATSLEMVM